MCAELQSDLIKQLKDGSKDAFNQLYMLYADKLYSFVFKLTKSHIDAEDILQEAFTRVWINHKNISETLPFKSYLFKITYNLTMDKFRKKVYSVDFQNFINSDYYQSIASNDIENKINFDDYMRIFNDTLAQLTPRQQEVFYLSRRENYSAKDIGIKLDISERTVNNHLSITLSILRKRMLLYILTLIHVI